MATEDFKDLLSGSIETGVRRSLERLSAMARGIWVPEGVGDCRLLVSELALPSRLRSETSPAPIDYVDTFVALDDYVLISEMPGSSAEALVRQIVGSQNPRTLLLQLAFLNHLVERPQQANRLAAGYSDALRPNLKGGFEEAMRGGKEESEKTYLVSRQGALAAVRAVFEARTWGREGLEEPSLATSILLVHAVSARMSEIRDGGKTIGQIPVDLMMDLVRNGLFNENDDDYSVLDRALRIWEDLDSRPMRTPLRATPRELLEETLGGVGFEDFFALGARLWAHAKVRDPLEGGGPMTLPADLPDIVMEREFVDEFLERVIATPEWFASEFEGRNSEYDFLAFQARPVARLGEELLVLDETYLLQKFTTIGLFWAVHDNERDYHSDIDRQRWNQAHGELMEDLVTERLRETAPAVPDRPGGKSFYSEQEMKEAYPDSRVADAAVDYGSHFLLFEVTGGQPVVGTRVAGDPRKFEADTEKLVLEEAEQLHACCESLLTGQKRLTGYDPPPNRKIVPILVVAGGYPSDALSRSYVDDVLKQKGWPQNKAIEPLCILDLVEVEILESLHEVRKNPGELLGRWKRSGLRNIGFKNFVLREVDRNLPRPSRMKARVQEALDAAAARLTGQRSPDEGGNAGSNEGWRLSPS
jgi:hypothetical protein